MLQTRAIISVRPLAFMLKVSLFLDFAEDHRLSMEAYASGLTSALRSECWDCDIAEYRPVPFQWPESQHVRMRLSRYIAYPLQARSRQSDVNHIVDHGYGHLLRFMDASRTVVSVFDLIPLLRWKALIPGVRPARKPVLNLFSFRALSGAAHLIAASENTKTDLIRHLDCRDHQITVIAPGVDTDVFRPLSPQERRRAAAELGLPANGKRVVLLTGSQFYKNHTRALRVLKRVATDQRLPIQIAKTGPVDEAFFEVADKLGLLDAVSFLGVVPTASVARLYNAADLLFFPSLYEGFGWPPLEAMACGTPVVVSSAASLPSVVGDAALIADPLDEDELAKAVTLALTDVTVRQRLIAAGLARVKEFSWRSTARQTRVVYDKVLAGPAALGGRVQEQTA